MNDELGDRRPKCVRSCHSTVQQHRKRHLGDEEATAKQMYIKASERASQSFARRRGNRQPGSSLVLSKTGKALAWLGLAWLGSASRVTVVLVGLGKGRDRRGVVLVTVRCSCCCCAVLVCCVRIVFFHLLSKLSTCLSRDPTILP